MEWDMHTPKWIVGERLMLYSQKYHKFTRIVINIYVASIEFMNFESKQSLFRACFHSCTPIFSPFDENIAAIVE
jgi:hypothetical protein